MTSADNPDPDLSPIPEPAMTPELRRAIDAVMLAAHALRHSLPSDAPPLDAPLRAAVDAYWTRPPLLSLWMACAAHEGLRKEWSKP